MPFSITLSLGLCQYFPGFLHHELVLHTCTVLSVRCFSSPHYSEHGSVNFVISSCTHNKPHLNQLNEIIRFSFLRFLKPSLSSSVYFFLYRVSFFFIAIHFNVIFQLDLRLTSLQQSILDSSSRREISIC